MGLRKKGKFTLRDLKRLGQKAKKSLASGIGLTLLALTPNFTATPQLEKKPAEAQVSVEKGSVPFIMEQPVPSGDRFSAHYSHYSHRSHYSHSSHSSHYSHYSGY